MKKCRTCGELKDESEYYSSNKERGWLRGQCKKCFNKEVNERVKNADYSSDQSKYIVAKRKRDLRIYFEYNQLVKKGKKQKLNIMYELASKYGVTMQTIYNIRASMDFKNGHIQELVLQNP